MRETHRLSMYVLTYQCPHKKLFLLIHGQFMIICVQGLTPCFNPNRSLGRICYVFYYYLLPFVFYKASDACFLLSYIQLFSPCYIARTSLALLIGLIRKVRNSQYSQELLTSALLKTKHNKS